MERKYLDIELMRILACFFVIFNHTGYNGFFYFSQIDNQSFAYWAYLGISIFCRFSVPLFFTITGALLLDDSKQESLGKLWGHRVIRMIIVLLFWSLFYYLVGVYLGKHEFNIKEFAKKFLDGSLNHTFWYLYAYISMLMTLPLLKKFVKNLTEKDFVYMFSLVFVFSSLLPIVQYSLWQDRYKFNEYIGISWMCANIFIYPMLGHFLRTGLECFWNKKRILVLWIINIVMILIASYFTYFKANITGVLNEGSSQTFHGTFVMINCIAIFVTCKYIFQKIKIPIVIEKAIKSVGECSFGIYLLHIFFKDRMDTIKNFGGLQTFFHIQLHFNYMLSAFLYCGIIFLLGYVTTLILKKIPIINRMI